MCKSLKSLGSPKSLNPDPVLVVFFFPTPLKVEKSSLIHLDVDLERETPLFAPPLDPLEICAPANKRTSMCDNNSRRTGLILSGLCLLGCMAVAYILGHWQGDRKAILDFSKVTCEVRYADLVQVQQYDDLYSPISRSDQAQTNADLMTKCVHLGVHDLDACLRLCNND